MEPVDSRQQKIQARLSLVQNAIDRLEGMKDELDMPEAERKKVDKAMPHLVAKRDKLQAQLDEEKGLVYKSQVDRLIESVNQVDTNI